VLDILNFPQVYFFSDKIDIKNNSLFIDGYIDFHGVKIDKNITINFINENNIIKFKGGFDISLNDFNIPLPSLMFYKIDEKVDISFEIEFNNAS
jgi:polyisoprenoid-binding protein YceI